MRALLLAGAAFCLIAGPAAAQTMDHSAHEGHATEPAPAPAPADTYGGHHAPGGPMAAPADPHAGHDMQGMQMAPEAPATDPHAGHDMPPAASDPHAGHDASAMGAAPAAPQANYADRVWSAEAMAASRAALMREHGGGTFSQVMLNLAEHQAKDGKDGYRWDGEAWFGGDINRLTVRTEGEGVSGGKLEDAEVEALYSRAVGPYFNLQAGVRHDFRPDPSRTYAAVGFEGLAPYWFEVEGTLYLSDKGDVLARFQGSYDQRITQRLILQPRAELNFAAQDVAETGVGSGLSNAELGLRLRYEVRRELAPYVGVSWSRSFGDTARFVRAAGERVEATSVVIGVRTWF